MDHSAAFESLIKASHVAAFVYGYALDFCPSVCPERQTLNTDDELGRYSPVAK
jgi:hypothetical protein